MFIQSIEKLITANDEDAEENALAELLTIARNTDINYGYRVFNKTQDKRALPEELDSMFDDELLVTIFVGEKAPYQEFKWSPKYNGHITRLIMP
jgi:hypothetical protein